MTEHEELIAWAMRNKKDGMGRWRTPDEMAHYAIMNEFDPMVVYKVFVDWQVGFGLDTTMREACVIGCEIAFIERRLPMHESWECLGRYLTTGQEWEAL